MNKIVYKKYSVDSKNLSTLFLVLFWLVLGLIICFIGITKTYAATTTTYENIGYLNDVTVLYSLADDPPYPLEIPRGGEYQLYNVEKIMVQIDNYTFSGGTTYNLELSLPISTLTNNIYSVIDENGNKCSIGTTDSSNSSYPNYSFNCTKETSHLTLNIYNTDGSDVLNAGIFRWNYIYLRKQLTTTDTSILENQQSQMIEQNQQIIQGQDEIKDTIKDQFNSCKPSVNLFNENLASDISNYIVSLGSNYNALPIQLDPNTQYTISTSVDNTVLSDSSFVLMFRTYDSPNYNLFILNSETSLQNITSRSLTFTTGNNGILYLVNRYATNTKLTEYFKSVNVQIEKGSIATKYGPYGGQVCYNKLDEQNETQKGIWATIKDLPNMFLDMLLGLFIPDDLSFIDNFKDVISNKLGFIASIPIQIIDFMLGLANVAFEEITTISFPSISIFGFNFWNAEEIDITILLDKLKPFKYFTDFTCVILCCRTLYDFYHSFTGGDVN